MAKKSKAVKDSSGNYTPYTLNKLSKLYRQCPVPGTNKKIDKARSAKQSGWRVSKSGRLYFENRENRSDTWKEQYLAGDRKDDPLFQKPRRIGGGRRGFAMPNVEGVPHAPRLSPMRRKPIARQPDRQKKRLLIKDIIETKTDIRLPTKNSNEVIVPTRKTKMTDAEKEKLLRKLALAIHTKRIEYIMAVNDYGLIYQNTSGRYGSCTVRPSLFRGKEVINMHNHPSNFGYPNPFSDRDMATFTHYEDNDEMRVCSHGYYYICKKTPYSKVLSKYSAFGRFSKKTAGIVFSTTAYSSFLESHNLSQNEENYNKFKKHAYKQWSDMLWRYEVSWFESHNYICEFRKI